MLASPYDQHKRTPDLRPKHDDRVQGTGAGPAGRRGLPWSRPRLWSPTGLRAARPRLTGPSRCRRSRPSRSTRWCPTYSPKPVTVEVDSADAERLTETATVTGTPRPPRARSPSSTAGRSPPPTPPRAPGGRAPPQPRPEAPVRSCRSAGRGNSDAGSLPLSRVSRAVSAPRRFQESVAVPRSVSGIATRSTVCAAFERALRPLRDVLSRIQGEQSKERIKGNRMRPISAGSALSGITARDGLWSPRQAGSGARFLGLATV